MKLTCPECKSNKTRNKRGPMFLILLIIFLPWSLLFLLIAPYKICRECGHKWK